MLELKCIKYFCRYLITLTTKHLVMFRCDITNVEVIDKCYHDYENHHQSSSKLDDNDNCNFIHVITNSFLDCIMIISLVN